MRSGEEGLEERMLKDEGMWFGWSIVLGRLKIGEGDIWVEDQCL